MTALAKDRDTQKKDGILVSRKVAASTKIYAGSFVALNTTGYAVPGADTANYRFGGVADAQSDNSAGADGAKSVNCWMKGLYKFGGSGFTQADVGKSVYLSDDQTVALTSTNLIRCGRIVSVESATDVWVAIEVDKQDEIDVIPITYAGQVTGNVTSAVKFTAPYGGTIKAVRVVARAKGGTITTFTVDALKGGISLLSAAMDLGAVAAGTIVVGTLTAGVSIARGDTITMDIALAGTSPTANDITVTLEIQR